MMIAGLQKMTLLDYPGKVACTVFLPGCNFRCPFCQNSGLLDGAPPAMDDARLLAFLRSRRGLLDAVCVSGGEPTLSPGLPELLRSIRSLGFLTKLDTNGTRPDVLRSLLQEGLVDHVAMDVKSSPDRYAEAAGCPGLRLEPIEESLRLLRSGVVSYELRTTVAAELHDVDTIRRMGQWTQDMGVDPIPAFYLQPFRDGESVLRQGLHTPDESSLSAMLEALRPFAASVAVRG